MFIELCEMWPRGPHLHRRLRREGNRGPVRRTAPCTARSCNGCDPSARTFRALLPLYPAAIESFDLSDYDLVVSSSSAWAHAVLCDERTVHVSYCHNPFRYAWNDRDQTLARLATRSRGRSCAAPSGAGASGTGSPPSAPTATWPTRAPPRPGSAPTSGARPRVVYPPVNTARFSPGPVGDHYVVVSELMPHKRIDVAVAAFNALRLPLIVIGDGPDARRLRRDAGPDDPASPAGSPTPPWPRSCRAPARWS